MRQRRTMQTVVISDTHGKHDRVSVPPCDVLVHCGDVSFAGGADEIESFCTWFTRQPARHRIFIAGNHDFLFEREPAKARAIVGRFDVLYLEDEAVEIDGLHVYGTPWQPAFLDLAFNVTEEADREELWERIPEGLDLLVTHTPPHGVLDRLLMGGASAGCAALARRVETVRPRVHAFGHIHEAHGIARHGDTLFVNAAFIDAAYEPTNAPVELTL